MQEDIKECSFKFDNIDSCKELGSIMPAVLAHHIDENTIFLEASEQAPYIVER